MEVNLFISSPCIFEQLFRISHLCTVICHKDETETVEPCGIPLSPPDLDQSRQPFLERRFGIQNDDIHQEPVTDIHAVP